MKDIEKVLNALQGSIEDDNIALYKELMEKRELKHHNGSPEETYFSIIYPFKKFLGGYLSLHTSQENRFIYENYNFLDRHLANLFNKHEGMPCSHDKSRAVINRIVRYHDTRETIKFDKNSEYTFHHPKIIMTDHLSIMKMYNALKQLYYGNPDRYMAIVSSPPYTM